MLKFGVVTQQDETKCQVRVKFDDQDNMNSYWIAVLQRKTLKDKHYDLPDIGEHVACLMDEHCEEGIILGALYSTADTVPAGAAKGVEMKQLADGHLVSHNQNTKNTIHKEPGDVNKTVQGTHSMTAGYSQIQTKTGFNFGLSGTQAGVSLDKNGLGRFAGQGGMSIIALGGGKVCLVGSGLSFCASEGGPEVPWELDQLTVKVLIVTQSSALAAASAESLEVSGTATIEDLTINGTLTLNGKCVGCANFVSGSSGGGND